MLSPVLLTKHTQHTQARTELVLVIQPGKLVTGMRAGNQRTISPGPEDFRQEQDVFVGMSHVEKFAALEKCTDHSPGGKSDPLLVLFFNKDSLAAASANGPHVDAYGSPDARDIPTLEATLVANGAQKLAFATYAFESDNNMHAVSLDKSSWLLGACQGCTFRGHCASH